jgi:hypothetical protein
MADQTPLTPEDDAALRMLANANFGQTPTVRRCG